MGWVWSVAVVAVVGMMLLPTAAPCSCLLWHPQQHVCKADFVVLARVRRLTETPDGNKAYKVKVKKLVKGSEKVELSLQKGLIYTDSGTCAAHLKTRTSHIITGNIVANKPRVNLCNFAAPMRSLTPKMKKGFRLLYKLGCDCPIMSCHFWEQCPKANFFCPWETSREKNDCQGRQSMCLRGPDGTCDWLRGRLYTSCMKTLRGRANATDTNNTQDNRIPRYREPLRFGYKRIRGHGTRPRRPFRPRQTISRIGYVPKNGWFFMHTFQVPPCKGFDILNEMVAQSVLSCVNIFIAVTKLIELPEHLCRLNMLIYAVLCYTKLQIFVVY